MKSAERELLERMGVKPGPDLLYCGLLALARRVEELQRQLDAREQRGLVSKLRRAVGRAA